MVRLRVCTRAPSQSRKTSTTSGRAARNSAGAALSSHSEYSLMIEPTELSCTHGRGRPASRRERDGARIRVRRVLSGLAVVPVTEAAVA